MTDSVCPVCSKDALVTHYESGEIICKYCGSVLPEKLQRIDIVFKEGKEEPEERATAKPELGTDEFLKTTRDVNKKPISKNIIDAYERQQKYLRQGKSNKEKNWDQAMKIFGKFRMGDGTAEFTAAAKIALYNDNIESRAQILYKITKDWPELYRNPRTKELVTACIYKASKMEGSPMLLANISEITNDGFNSKKVQKGANRLYQKLNMDLWENEKYKKCQYCVSKGNFIEKENQTICAACGKEQKNLEGEKRGSESEYHLIKGIRKWNNEHAVKVSIAGQTERGQLGIKIKKTPKNDGHFRYGANYKIRVSIGKIQDKSLDILKTIRKRSLLVGKNPKGIAAGALYYVCTGNLPPAVYNGVQHQIAAAFDVHVLTIQRNHKQLMKTLGDEV